MTSTLEVEEFSDSDIDDPEIQAFHSGDEPWAQEVNNWLKAPLGEDGALSAIHQDPPCQVFKYYVAGGGPLVGFAGIGKSPKGWHLAGKKEPAIDASVLLMFGVNKVCRRKPDGPWEKRYSSEIMRHVVFVAERHKATHPVLGLYVQAGNKGAITLYERHGFAKTTLKPRKIEGAEYIRMVRVLNPALLCKIVGALLPKDS